MSRAKFEAEISNSPYYADIRRFGEDSAWPGNYRDIGVDLAWRMWLAGRESMRDEAAAVCDEMTLYTGFDCAQFVRKIEP